MCPIKKVYLKYTFQLQTIPIISMIIILKVWQDRGGDGFNGFKRNAGGH